MQTIYKLGGSTSVTWSLPIILQGLFLVPICRLAGMVSCLLCFGQFNERSQGCVTGGVVGFVACREPAVSVTVSQRMITQAYGGSVTGLGQLQFTEVHIVENVVKRLGILLLVNKLLLQVDHLVANTICIVCKGALFPLPVGIIGRFLTFPGLD